jgi:hypothetical protein
MDEPARLVAITWIFEKDDPDKLDCSGSGLAPVIFVIKSHLHGELLGSVFRVEDEIAFMIIDPIDFDIVESIGRAFIPIWFEPFEVEIIEPVFAHSGFEIVECDAKEGLGEIDCGIPAHLNGERSLWKGIWGRQSFERVPESVLKDHLIYLILDLIAAVDEFVAEPRDHLGVEVDLGHFVFSKSLSARLMLLTETANSE